MDRDFFEHSYSFTQPRQEESVSDELSRLIYPLANGRDPTEQVGITIDIFTETTVPPSPQSTPVLEYPSKQEEITDPSIDDANNNVPSDNVPRRYELPPRSARGVPPNRYDRSLNLRDPGVPLSK